MTLRFHYRQVFLVLKNISRLYRKNPIVFEKISSTKMLHWTVNRSASFCLHPEPSRVCIYDFIVDQKE